ncbi:AAA family ATPase [Paenibacillus sp. FSL H8-0457]|uniref:ATP-dependent nuclease n=1 Tax=unclassified Paenibacillus TaxID=185978 RepID=UPI0003E1C9C2|nr:AAA family ATPase [Paenibacillus sp. FSL H8-457]ETT60804.1 ATP-dependent OLD family endonuclease [Paenibacillus sp. FSL H8-457]
MYLERICIWNWRKFEVVDNEKASIEIVFNKHLNVIVGENDSGKTAIIDAIKAGLSTNSQDVTWILESDFFDPSLPIKIEYFYKELTEDEEAFLYEWLYFVEKESIFRVVLEVENIKDLNGKQRISRVLLGGEAGKESVINDNVRHLLSVTYLKPLRDAESELSPGNRSRFAQILKNLNVFQENDGVIKKEIEEILTVAFSDVQQKIDDPVLNKMEDVVQSFFDKSRERKPVIQPRNMKFDEFVKKLELNLGEIGTGLGSSNLLFMAAELLLLSENKFGPQLALIEEIEAHIHPQSQLRLIKYFEKKSKEDGIQYILTSHSPILASSISLEHIILIYNNRAYPMHAGLTLLDEDDYKFLERFLDATKSNMFFARGIIMVEGDSENLLIPALAEIIDRPLYDYGVSIVNVGNLAFKRYASILLRADSQALNFPVSIVTDVDLKPRSYFDKNYITYFEVDNSIEGEIGALFDYDFDSSLVGSYFTFDILLQRIKGKVDVDPDNFVKLISLLEKFKNKKYEDILLQKIHELETRYYNNVESTKVFISSPWTLEFAIAESGLSEYLQDAVLEINFVTLKNRVAKKAEWNIIGSVEKKAVEIYRFMLTNQISKAAVAQILANKLIENKTSVSTIFRSDPKLKYLYDSILHVTGGC